MSAISYVEKLITRRLIEALLAEGFCISINNGGSEDEISDSKDLEAILASMRAADEDYVLVNKPGTLNGWVRLIYGNGGFDVISDYTTNLESVIQSALILADKIDNA